MPKIQLFALEIVGTTTEAIAHECGAEKTLLGVDVIRDRELVTKDADERTPLALTENEQDIWIIISPIGAQGFIIGRGNQQISAAVIRRAGINHVIVTGTPPKLRHTPELYIDTGDPALDAEFGKSVPVISGYKITQRIPVHVRK